MKVIVTGGAGFIGSHVAEVLKDDGHEVLIVDNLSTGRAENLPKDIPFVELDICDDRLLDVILDFQPEVIFHLAAQIDVQKSINDPAFDAYINIVGTVKLLEAAGKAKVRKVVYSSSAACYGEPQSLPVTEEQRVMPLSAYGISKHTAEHYLVSYKELYNIDYSILRYGNVYGPRQDPLGEAGVVAIFTDRVLKGLAPTIFGDGEQTRDFIYVKDIATANLLAGKASGCQLVNISTGVETSVNEVFNKLIKYSNISLDAKYAPGRKGEIQKMVMCAEKALKEIGFKSQYSFDEGIKETLLYYKQKQ